jgi:hypothetical protein
MCGYCGQAVVKHRDTYEEIADGKSQLYHLKRCWPREKRRRAKAVRLERKLARRALEAAAEPGAPAELKQLAVEAALVHQAREEDRAMEREMPWDPGTPSPEEELPRCRFQSWSKRTGSLWTCSLMAGHAGDHFYPGRPGAHRAIPPNAPRKRKNRRGLRAVVFEVLDGLEGMVTLAQVMLLLKRMGVQENKLAVRSQVMRYGKQRRPYTMLRGAAAGAGVYEFGPREPVPPPITDEEAEAMDEVPPPLPPVVEPVSQAVQELAAQPMPRAAIRAIIDRELNDFQAMLLEMVATLRADLKRLVEE